MRQMWLACSCSGVQLNSRVREPDVRQFPYLVSLRSMQARERVRRVRAPVPLAALPGAYMDDRERTEPRVRLLLLRHVRVRR